MMAENCRPVAVSPPMSAANLAATAALPNDVGELRVEFAKNDRV